MADATALQKFHCPACGAEAVWNPARQALMCGYCGTVSPATRNETTGEIVEHDLVTALRRFGQGHRGWQAEKRSVRCQSCRAISVFDSSHVAGQCDFCGSAALVPYEQTQAPIHPESILPLKVSESAVRESMRRWYGSRWFAPNRLKSAALTDTVHGVYLPYWTFDAHGHARWTALSGYHHYTTETYRDASGRTQTRQVRHTRWQPTSGAVEHVFDDELVCASRGVDETLLRKVEPFPTSDLVPYEARFIAGWVVEQYQLDLVGAAQKSRARMDAALTKMCASRVPGDTHRNLRVHTTYSDQTFKHILVPVWLLTFNYGSRTYQAVVNGHTGTIAGRHPRSWVKITLFALVLLVAILAGMAMFGR